MKTCYCDEGKEKKDFVDLWLLVAHFTVLSAYVESNGKMANEFRIGENV